MGLWMLIGSPEEQLQLPVAAAVSCQGFEMTGPKNEATKSHK